MSQTKIRDFKIHQLTKAQYDNATKSENDLYLITDDGLTPLAFAETSQAKVFKSSQAVGNNHVHVLFEIETGGAHYGCDFDLHPYNSSECIVAIRMLIGGSYVDGSAYLDSASHVVVDMSKATMTGYTAIGKYCEY